MRAAVYAAQSGHIVDLTGLNCETISLTSSIVTAADDLTIQATGGGKYKIDGGNAVRPITHNGTGKLTLDGITVVRGKVEDDVADGGCIKSRGEVAVRNGAQIKYCEANGRFARGGAIFAEKNIRLENGVRLANNRAYGSEMALGGGVYTKHLVSVQGAVVEKNKAKSSWLADGGGIAAKNISTKYATVRDNTAFLEGYSNATGTARGGGASLTGIGGTSLILRSTFSGNKVQVSDPSLRHNAVAEGSALYVFTGGNTFIQSSTIAKNSSRGGERGTGAVAMHTGNISILNSTISQNTEGFLRTEVDDGRKYGAGLTLAPNTGVRLESSIIAGNYRDTIEGEDEPLLSDIGFISPVAANNASHITGSKNFINYHHPAITWASNDNMVMPLEDLDLGDLRDNGGMNHTMMPNDDSPVINKGASMNNTTDQRGTGYVRIHGPQADIGAVEWGSKRPEIFDDGFEG